MRFRILEVFLAQAISLMSPHIREIICDELDKLKVTAEASDNVFDDLAIKFLIKLFQCKD